MKRSIRRTSKRKQMMRVSHARGQTFTVFALVVAGLFLVIVNARKTSFRGDQSQYRSRSVEDLAEWSGSRYSQCISSWEEIMSLVPELGTVGNNHDLIKGAMIKGATSG